MLSDREIISSLSLVPSWAAPSILYIGFLVWGTFTYMICEGWSIIDSFYFTSTTMKTIGFGDLHPHSLMGRMCTVILIYAASGITSLLLVQCATYQLTLTYPPLAPHLSRFLPHIFGRRMITISQFTIRQKLVFLSLLVQSHLLLGSLLFMLFESMSFWRAWYMCVVMSSSVGYGDVDFVPVTALGRLWAGIYVIIANGITFMFVSTIGTYLIRLISIPSNETVTTHSYLDDDKDR